MEGETVEHDGEIGDNPPAGFGMWPASTGDEAAATFAMGWIDNARVSFPLDPRTEWAFNDRPFASIDGRTWWLIDGKEHDRLTEGVARLSADRERLAVLALEAVDELEGWVRSELEGTSYFRENMDAIEARDRLADLRGEGQ